MENASQKRRVLVVEDDTLQAMNLENIMQESGYEVVGPTGNIDDALWLIRTQKIDAAILDVQLAKQEPVYPAARALQRRKVPFVFATAFGRAAPKKEGFKELSLQKPLERAVVEKVVNLIAHRETS